MKTTAAFLSRTTRVRLGEFFTDLIGKKVAKQTPRLESQGLLPIRIDRGTPRGNPPAGFIDVLKKSQDISGAHIYSNPLGELFYREAIAKYMGNRFGVNVNPENEICALPGTNVGLFWMLREILEEGTVILPSPGYPTYYSAANLKSQNIYTVSLNPDNKFMPDLYHATKDAHGKLIAIVINYPHNPTGAVASLDYLKHIVDFASKNNILIISDLAYSEIYLPNGEKPHSIFEVQGAKDVAVEFHSLSKSFAVTGDRAAFAVGRPDVIEYLRDLIAHINIGNMPIPLQHAAAFVLTDSSCQGYIDRMNQEYSVRRELMLAGLRGLGWDVNSENKGTFYIWTPIPEQSTDSQTFADNLLDERGVVIVPGAAFGSDGKNHVRISLVQPPNKLTEAIERMKR